ncbi:Protein phosphatase 2C 29 [Capsicum chinense]|nr:Protein phosphatase 2C 29 [Capsicum chinense]
MRGTVANEVICVGIMNRGEWRRRERRKATRAMSDECRVVEGESKRWDWRSQEKVEEKENRVEEEKTSKKERRRKTGPVDHELVLRAMYRALEVTELTYLDMTDRVLDRYPEVALMGSFLLAALMRDEDVYVMNVGDSHAIVEKYEPEKVSSSSESKGPCDGELTV